MKSTRLFLLCTLILFGAVGCDKKLSVKQGNVGVTGTTVTGQTGETADPTPTPTPPPKSTQLWATLDAATQISSTAPVTMKFNRVIRDSKKEYDPATGIFLAQESGVYTIVATLTVPGPWATGDYCKIWIGKYNSVIAVNQSVMPAHQKECSATVTATIPVAKGENIQVMATLAGAARSTVSVQQSPYNFVNIVRVADSDGTY